MTPLPPGTRIWLALGKTDMRRGMAGLALQIQETVKLDPHSGHVFVFRGRRGDLLKAIWHVRPHEDGGAAMLDPMWARMGRVMIAKCAEAQALRRGWPDVISSLYSEDELQSANLREALASERLRPRDIERPTSGQSLWFCFDPTVALEAVSRCEIAGRLLEHYGQLRSSDEFCEFETRNRQSLHIFWEWEPCDAHILKELVEERAALLSQCAEASQNSGLS
jgi:transposase